jgi:hypothetical protein
MKTFGFYEDFHGLLLNSWPSLRMQPLIAASKFYFITLSWVVGKANDMYDKEEVHD